MKFALASLLLAASVDAKVYFKDSFNEPHTSRWTVSSDWKSKAEMGEWKTKVGKWYGDKNDKSLFTTENARFYGLSAKLDEPITNKGKDLVIQYIVKNEQELDCGGAYIKLLGSQSSTFKATTFGGSTPYSVMFGPDICGSSTRRTHVILNYPPGKDAEAKDDNNLLIKKDVKCETDSLSHLYTLHIKPDDTFEVSIDGKTVREGKLEDEFAFLPPATIPDPSQSKPLDWVDSKTIPDPTAVKPDGYDDIPKTIPSPTAYKPEDWNEEDDGAWEAPQVPNPDYKGPWVAKTIPNPDYKGPWVHPQIANPKYAPASDLHARCDGCTHLGFELWQVTAGTSFDDIIVTDSVEEARAFAEETFFKKQEAERKMHDDIKAKEKEEADKKREEERLKAEAEKEAEGEDDGADHDEF